VHIKLGIEQSFVMNDVCVMLSVKLHACVIKMFKY